MNDDINDQKNDVIENKVNKEIPQASASIEEQIAKMVPKSLDDIFRQNREYGSIGLADPLLIKDLHADLTYSLPEFPLEDCRFIEIELAGVPEAHLVGITLYGQFRMTSPVRKVDLDRGLVITRSGTLYRLRSTGQGEPPVHQLVSLCAILRKWPIGAIFGVPKWFF